jgi:hypothetical protein
MKCVFCGNTKVLFKTTIAPFFTVCLKCAITNNLSHLRKVGEHSVKEQVEEESSRAIQPPLPFMWDYWEQEEQASSTSHKE